MPTLPSPKKKSRLLTCGLLVAGLLAGVGGAGLYLSRPEMVQKFWWDTRVFLHSVCTDTEDGCPEPRRDPVSSPTETYSGQPELLGRVSVTPQSAAVELAVPQGVRVQVPAGAVRERADLHISQVANPPAPPYHAYEPVAAFDISVGTQRQFADPLTLEFDLRQLGLQSSPDLLRQLYAAYWSEEAGQWVQIRFRLDPVTLKAVCETRHLTVYAWFMRKLGYNSVTLGRFEIVYNKDLFTAPRNKLDVKEIESKMIYASANDLAALYPSGLPPYLADPALPTCVRDAGGYLNHALDIYEKAGFKIPATPLNVLIDGSVWDKILGDATAGARDKSTGIIRIGTTNTGSSQLRRLVAHELFHAIQNEYYWDLGGMTFMDWWCEATADYAADVVVTGLKTPVKPLSPLYFSSALTDTKGEHPYETAHFVHAVVGDAPDKGKALHDLWKSVAAADWYNLFDATYPISEYLKAKGKTGLNSAFRDFVLHGYFHPESPLPALAGGLMPATSATEDITLPAAQTACAPLKVTLKGGLRAKLLLLRAEMQGGQVARDLTLSLDGPLGGHHQVTLHLLADGKRQANAVTPSVVFGEQRRKTSVRIRAQDVIAIALVNTDPSRSASYSLSVTQKAPTETPPTAKAPIPFAQGFIGIQGDANIAVRRTVKNDWGESYQNKSGQMNFSLGLALESQVIPVTITPTGFSATYSYKGMNGRLTIKGSFSKDGTEITNLTIDQSIKETIDNPNALARGATSNTMVISCDPMKMKLANPGAKDGLRFSGRIDPAHATVRFQGSQDLREYKYSDGGKVDIPGGKKKSVSAVGESVQGGGFVITFTRESSGTGTAP